MTTNKTKELTPEEIASNWEKFRTLCNGLGERAELINAMLDVIEERMSLAPASSRTEHHNCFPGGLVDHSLRVARNAMILAKSFFPDLLATPEGKESVVLVALFHDLGKVGNEEKDNYIPQTSDWHRDKLGELYQTNKEMQFMSHAHRSVFMLQRFGVRLTEDEWLAILIHDGQYVDENRKYSMKEPALAAVVSLADVIATKQEKLL